MAAASGLFWWEACAFWWSSCSGCLGSKCEGALFHLVGHQIEGIGAGGSEMFLEAGAVDEAHVCGEDRIG